MSSKKINRKSLFKKVPQELLRFIFEDKRLHALNNLFAPTPLNYKKLAKQARPNLERYFESEHWVRPPGSLNNVREFEKKCTQCGDCAKSCNYNAIQVVEGLGPLLSPNLTACHHCKDYPCIQACETGALKKLKKNFVPSFGKAMLLENNCINITKNQNLCRKCEEVCPIPFAIDFENKKKNLPHFTEYCTGCGLCREVCPSEPKAIQIQKN